MTNLCLQFVVTLAILLTVETRFPRRPKRCCSPDVWEADVMLPGSTTRIWDPNGTISSKFSYDYTNQRWAVDYRDSNDSEANIRLVYDYNKNSRILIRKSGCLNLSLEAPMGKYCIPANSSYHGYFDYGLNEEKLGYDMWSYDVMGRPMRFLLRLSRDGCTPLQLTSYGLIKNSWSWESGEDPCNPWQYPDRAVSGDCFRSHVTVPQHVLGTRMTAAFSNMEFRNINLTITNENIFKVPKKCQEIDDYWPSNMKWNILIGSITLRMKPDDATTDQGAGIWI